MITLQGKRLYEVLDLCLECKACKAECPSNVDMAKLKYEFLAHYYKKNGLPLRNRLFGNIAELSEIGSAFAPMSNWFMNSGISKWAMEKFTGIDRRRSLPNFVRETFEKWFQKHQDSHTDYGNENREAGCAFPRYLHELQLPQYR